MKIIGTGCAHPALTVTNQMLETFLDTSNEWIVTRTGIERRKIISDEKLEDLAAEAANKALKDANVTADEIDFMICSNVINEYITPALGCIVQGKIGAKCPTIDLNGACAGFIYALDIAEGYLMKDRIKHVLVVCAEEPTRMVDWGKRDASVLFGDGAGAVVLTKGDCLKSVRLTTTSKPESLYQTRKLEFTPFTKKPEPDGPLVMKGQDVFKLAVTHSFKDIVTVVKEAGLELNDIDHYLLHQANLRIIDTIRHSLKLDESKFHHNIQNYGNTSSATIPILMDELNRAHVLKDGDMMVLSAFGAGFTTGACVMEWHDTINGGKENI